MFWIALSPPPDADRQAWTWWALRFTPRVALVEEAMLLEVSGSLRLFGGKRALLKALLSRHSREGGNPSLPDSSPTVMEAMGPRLRGDDEMCWAAAGTSLVALALLRCKLRGIDPPAQRPDDLPLDLLTAAKPHVGVLERTGTTTWGQLRALPRGGVSRRFGADLVAALDASWGERPEQYPWCVLPEDFDLTAELVQVAETAPALMVAADHLLERLHLWLQARNRGLLALELEWTLDLRRLNGVRLPAKEQLPVRTAQPTQDMAHLRRLVAEHLDRATLSAPANHLRLRSIETVPWGGMTTSLLPQDRLEGERLHQLVERLSVRLGEENVVVPVPHQDHRPECKQAWAPARSTPVDPTSPMQEPDALYPSWVLPHPLRLKTQGETPCFGGPLRRLARLYRLETSWWEDAGPTLRDYFIARSPQSGLVWIYRERPAQLARELAEHGGFAWYLQGLYA